MVRPTIGVIVPRMGAYYITSVLHGIEDVLGPLGYEVMITHSHGSALQEAAIARLLLQQGVCGLIASLVPGTGDSLHLNAFRRREMPVVLFDQEKETGRCTNVIIDDHQCGWMAAEHLVRQGCRRIALCMPDRRQRVNTLRYDGFVECLGTYGISFSDDLLVVGKMDEGGGAYAAGRLMERVALPDGVFVTGDVAAASCMNAWWEAGVRVPDDIAVVGLGNEPVGRLVNPSLTTIDYPGYEVGTIAAANLHQSMTGGLARMEASTLIVPAKLIVRKSSLRIRTEEPHAEVTC